MQTKQLQLSVHIGSSLKYRLRSFYRKYIFALYICAAAGSALAFVAPLGANSLFLLEVNLSLLPHLLVFCVVVIAMTVFWNQRLAAGLTALTFIAAQPFLFFSDFEAPSGSECGPDECVKVMTINLLGESEYLPALSELITEYDVDIVAVTESSRKTIDPRFQDVFFANFDSAIHAMWLNMPRGMGNPISLLSRVPIDDFVRVLNHDTGGRAYIAADLGENWHGIRIVMAHAMSPTSHSGLIQRNALIEDITQVALESTGFIVLGDFNVTPWSPKFAVLPGKRAGDPRFSMTWPTSLPMLGISIDHIMFSDDLELVEFEVLRSIGSDHYPVMAVFKRKDS